MIKTETINGVEYQIGKLGPFEAFHVARKLAPLLAHAIPALLQFSGEGAEAKPDFEVLLFSAAAVPIAEVLCNMSQPDADYVLHQCLSVVQRRQAKGWAKVFANGVLMFQDVEVDTMFMLTKAVCEVSLARFFPTSQPESATPAE